MHVINHSCNTPNLVAQTVIWPPPSDVECVAEAYLDYVDRHKSTRKVKWQRQSELHEIWHVG